jgi:CPA1 family monovalent cation:H+ antiporter
MVMVGLLIGNHGRDTAMSDATRHHVDIFWELIDEILNAVLFVLLGLEIILLSLSWRLFGLSVAVIAITTFARWLTVGLPISLTERRMQLPNGAWKVLTWGGLRGNFRCTCFIFAWWPIAERHPCIDLWGGYFFNALPGLDYWPCY